MKDRERAGRPAAARQLPKILDDLIYEFRIKDENPHAVPKLRLDRVGPFPAYIWQTIRQTITCGDMPRPPGSSFVLARMLISDGDYYYVRITQLNGAHA